MMLITRTSLVSGKTRSMYLEITPDQIVAWERGKLIQHAMPNLTADEREFFLSGITDEEWDSMFTEEEKNDG